MRGHRSREVGWDRSVRRQGHLKPVPFDIELFDAIRFSSRLESVSDSSVMHDSRYLSTDCGVFIVIPVSS